MSSLPESVESRGRWRALALLAAAELFAMSLWFSASAVVPAIRAEWSLSDTQAGWLTLSVQLGFVAGTLVSAVFNLSDVMNTRRLLALSAVCGAIVNAAFALSSDGLASAVALRFLTGLFLAGVYPPGDERGLKLLWENRLFVLRGRCFLTALVT